MTASKSKRRTGRDRKRQQPDDEAVNAIAQGREHSERPTGAEC